ncbi:MAG: hypothetical protein LBQ31_05560 [Bacteroidales bacterium]|jgi:chromosome segregation ATPase|nr:hypothetical protein [Bacteroidales bacterium]
MRKILCFFVICTALIAAGCQTNRVKSLEKENTQLRSEIVKSDSIQTQFMNVYSEIEHNLSEIREREKSIDRYSGEPNITKNSSMQEKILDDIAAIGRLLEDNRIKLSDMQRLQKQLVAVKKENSALKAQNRRLSDDNRGGVVSKTPSQIEIENRATRQLYDRQMSELQQKTSATTSSNAAANAEIARLNALNLSLQNTITQLRQHVAESEARIEALQEELSLLKEAYAALQAINEGLQAENSKYREDLASNRTALDQKDAEISRLNEVVQTAFYYIGSKKDAAAKGLVAKSGTSPAYKDADFIRIENIFEKKIIETKSAKAEVMSNHPKSSYSYDTKDKQNIKIVIKDPDQFWKITRYLVVVTPK